MRADERQEYVDYVSSCLPALRQLAYVLCGDEHRADDVVQQAITKLYVHWRRVSRVEHLDQYVRTMLVRTFLDERRRPWSRVGLLAAPPEQPSRVDHHVEDAMVLRAALVQVPRRQQAVLVLRFLYDMSVEDVAETLGCSAGTVKSQTNRGLATLRRLLEANTVSSVQEGI